MGRFLVFALVLLTGWRVAGSGVLTFRWGEAPGVACLSPEGTPAVGPALSLFREDARGALGVSPGDAPPAEAAMVVGRPDELAAAFPELAGDADLGALRGLREGFLLKVRAVAGRPRLIVAGSDARGTAYAVLEVSRLLGVSPWTWWADLSPAPVAALALPEGFRRLSAPKVAWRGVFLNDEDWGFTPWAWKTHEPCGVSGRIGPRTHARLFGLLLRLRANLFWPAMHDCSEPFFLTPGNREVAERYGIALGTSHCEPLLCNINGEWRRATKAPYNWFRNREGVLAYWEKRVRASAGLDALYTIGMRGVHDGPMAGTRTAEERKKALGDVIAAQRELLSRTLRRPPEAIPQVFIPYKEVLDAYQAGLEVPPDVTLMWCDDNFGYLTHLPTAAERARPGGHGLYYHLSYWGPPHDYLWLATTSPALLAWQMRQAYAADIRQVWVFNVGDLKPAEYLTTLALDLAWDSEALPPAALPDHLRAWLADAFGEEAAGPLAEAFALRDRLAWVRRPEFMMGGDYNLRAPRDLPFAEDEIRARLAACDALDAAAEPPAALPANRRDAWFQLVAYPLRAFAEQNRKYLLAQLARHGLADWEGPRDAHAAIQRLTQAYNALAGGKWARMMSCAPRRLPVFKPVPEARDDSPLPKTTPGLALVPAAGEGTAIPGLGYGGRALALAKGRSLRFRAPRTGAFRAEIGFVPGHPVSEEGTLRARLDVGGKTVATFDLAAKPKSRPWEEHVLTNRVLRACDLALAQGQTITLTALDDGVVFDTFVLRPPEGGGTGR